jgi:hypothetical protein
MTGMPSSSSTSKIVTIPGWLRRAVARASRSARRAQLRPLPVIDAGREQHPLDGDLTVEQFVVTAPHRGHAALADRLDQVIPALNDLVLAAHHD